MAKHRAFEHQRPWQAKLAGFFASVWVELAVGALVIVSVALTLLEFTIAEATAGLRERALLDSLICANDIITAIFVVELTLRYFAASSKRHFISTLEISLREADETLYWLELLAESRIVKPSRLAALTDECSQLVAILAATIRTAKKRSPSNKNKPKS